MTPIRPVEELGFSPENPPSVHEARRMLELTQDDGNKAAITEALHAAELTIRSTVIVDGKPVEVDANEWDALLGLVVEGKELISTE